MTHPRYLVRRATSRRQYPVTRTREELAAIAVCQAVNEGRCSCRNTPAVCHTMVWAAKRALKVWNGEEQI